MTAVANAIRTKAGSSESLAFPDGFVTAVEGITTGGGGEPVTDPVAEKFRLVARNQASSIDLTWEDIKEWFGYASYVYVDGTLIDARLLNSIEVNPAEIQTYQHNAFYNIKTTVAKALTLKAPSDGVSWGSKSNSAPLFNNSWIGDIDEAFLSADAINDAFENCRFYYDVVVSEGVTSLKAAFRSATKQLYLNTQIPLTITLPSTLVSINGYHAIGGGYSTKLILILKATTPPTMDNSSGVMYVDSITVPKGSLEAYQTATNWSQFADIMVEATE